MKTKLRDLSEDDCVEYAEGSSLDDEFVEIDIINPHNKKTTLRGVWVPAEMRPELEAELAIRDDYGKKESWKVAYDIDYDIPAHARFLSDDDEFRQLDEELYEKAKKKAIRNAVASALREARRNCRQAMEELEAVTRAKIEKWDYDQIQEEDAVRVEVEYKYTIETAY